MTGPRIAKPGRRALVTTALTSVGVTALSACTSSPESASPTGTPAAGTSSPKATPSSTASDGSTARRLTTPKRWQPHPNDVEPACKLTAVRQIVAALTVDGTRASTSVPAVLRPLAEQVADMEQSVVDVVYPQYAGLTADRREASIMLVLDLIGITAGNTSTRTSMTMDVRLRRRSSWEITKVIVPDARQYDRAAPEGVKELLDSQQIELPREARLDLVSGRIDPALVEVMGLLSRRWHLGVQVLRTGHPEYVFGTNRRSNHAKGKAVDIWSLDRIPVIAQDRAPWRRAMESAASYGAMEIGGPADIGGPGPPYFTNAVHQDHLHISIVD